MLGTGKLDLRAPQEDGRRDAGAENRGSPDPRGTRKPESEINRKTQGRPVGRTTPGNVHEPIDIEADVTWPRSRR